MKTRFHKRSALLALSLLLIGLSLTCFLWVRKEQRQYRLNQQLLTAMDNGDTKKAIALVEAGADPNTRALSIPAPTLSGLINQLLRHAPPLDNAGPTAFLKACGIIITHGWIEEFWDDTSSKCVDSHLTHVMLLHGADINAKDEHSMTALQRAVATFAIHSGNKAIIKQLLEYGADPNSACGYGTSAIQIAKNDHRHDIVDLLCKYSKRH